MYVGMSKEHEALRDELRAYYDQLLTPEVEDDLRKGEGVGEASKDIWKKMAADGYAGVGWPKEWGGKGLTPDRAVRLLRRVDAAGAPVPMLTINSVAPTIMRFGSEEQKQFYVPKILAGRDPLRDRLHRARRRHRPRVAADTRAVRDGDEYVINGQKMFTSLASDADYIWLAVRTNPEVKKHKGISIIIVPTDTPGFRVRADRQLRRHQHEHHVLRRRARARRQPRRRGERRLGPHHEPAQPRARHAVLVGRDRAHARRRARVGAGDEARRRPARDRPGMGAGQPRPRARQARVPAARELAGRVARAERRRAEPGRRVDHQGLRHRVLHGGRAAAAWR